ncbi:hypothetical protein X801_10280, partial [Opisthorchis viverrini]
TGASPVVCKDEGVNKLIKVANDPCNQTAVSNPRSPSSARLCTTTPSTGGGLTHNSEVHSANTISVFIDHEADHVAEPLFATPDCDVGTQLPEETATFPNSLVVPEASRAINNNNRQLKSSNSKISSRVRPIPNFKRIHAQAAAKMESLPQYLERRCQARNETRPPFASPVFRGYTGAMRTGNLKDTINARAPVPLSDMTNIKRSASNLPADSAFARRKAYDTHRRLSTTPAKNTTTPKRTTIRGSPLRHSKNSAAPSDPRIVSFRAHVALQKQKAKTSAQMNRFITKRVLVDTNRGIRS